MKRHFIKAFAFSCAIAGTAIPAFITEAAPPMADNAVCFYSAFPNGSTENYSTEIASAPRYYVFEEKGKQGLIDSFGKTIIPAANYDKIYNIFKHHIVVKNGKKYGAVNFDGKEVVAPLYERLGCYTKHNFIQVTLKDKYGLFASDGTVILPPEYDYVSVDDNVIKVFSNKKVGVTDLNGKIILPCEFDSILVNDNIIAKKDEKYWQYQINGTLIGETDAPKTPEELLNYKLSNGGQIIKDGKNYNVINADGTPGVSVKADYIAHTDNGFYVVNKNKYSFYDSNFNLANEVKADSFTRLDNGLFAITRKKSGLSLGGLLSTAIAFGTGTPLYPGQVNWMRSNIKTGYLDSTGTEIIPTKNDYNGTFFEGHALVMVKDKFGYVDTAGNYLVPAEFDDISAFSFYDPDVVVVEKDDDFGFYDTKKGLFTSGYTAASNFVNGLAPIAIAENKWGYIDRTGNKVIRPKFDMVTPFFDENAMTKINGYYRIINKTGDTVANLETAEEAGALKNSSAPIKIDGKWGIVADNGSMLVEPVYKDLKIFNDFDSYFYNYQE